MPLSVLNSSNRKLCERVEHIKEEIAQVRYSCEDYHNVIQLLKINKRRAEREAYVLQQALSQTVKEVKDVNSSTLELEALANGEQRYAIQLSEELRVLKENVTRTEALSTAKQEAIRKAVSNSLVLEREVEEILDVNVASERKGSELQHGNRKEISSSIFSRLQKAQVEVQELELELSGSLNEHRHIMQQQNVVKEALAALHQDRTEVLHAMNSLQKEAMHCDQNIIQNSFLMEEMLSDSAEKKAVKHGLLKLREELKQRKALLEQNSATAVQRFDKLVFKMRQILEELMCQAKNAAALRRVGKKVKKQLLEVSLSAANATNFCEERMELLRNLQAQKQKSKECLDALSVEKRSLSSTSPPELVRNSLEGRLHHVAARGYGMLEKFDSMMDTLSQEREITKSLNTRLALFQKKREDLKEEFSTCHKRLTCFRSAQQSVEARIGEVRSGMSQAVFQSKAAAQVQSIMLRSEFMSLQKKVAVEISRSRQLHKRLASTNLQIRHALANIASAERTHGEKEERYLLLSTEIQSMEKELEQLRQLVEQQKTQQRSTEMAKKVLARTSRKVVEDVIGAAESEELLRGEVALQEAELEAERQRFLVAFHLEQNNLSAMVDNYNRTKKKLDLLIMRYKESVASLSRMTNVHFSSFLKDSCSTKETSGLDSTWPTFGAEVELSPEELHARFLLQKSCERELLLTRGNFLDKKVVRLSKEVEGLKKILASLREPSTRNDVGAITNKTVSTEGMAPTFADIGPKMETERTWISTDCIADPKSFSSAIGEIRQLEMHEKERTELLKEELDLYKESIREIEMQKRKTQQNLREMKEKLKVVKGIQQQKRLQLHKLQEDVRKLHHSEFHYGWR